jgi:hypothetical protein
MRYLIIVFLLLFHVGCVGKTQPVVASLTETPPADVLTSTQSIPLTQVVNGITMLASNFRIENGELNFDLCYDIPDSGDWTVWQANLRTESAEIEMLETALLELRHPAVDGIQEVITLAESTSEPDENNGLGLRCDSIRFFGAVSDSHHFTITIESILATPSESGVCDATYLARVNAELETYAVGLSAECFIVEYEGGGGSSGLEIAAWPETMTQQEAEAILADSDFYMDVHGIRGPWIFNVTFD